MSEIIGVITKKQSISDNIVKDVLDIVGGREVRRLGEAGCEFCISKTPSFKDLETVKNLNVDINFVNKKNREKQVVIADMDGTLIKEECLDELAELAGITQQVSSITKKAMRGILPFDVSIRKRAELLKGVSCDLLENCYEDRINLSAGANTFIRTMNSRNTFTFIASGGLHFFVSRVANSLNASGFVSNDIKVENKVLTGELIFPIIDEIAKLNFIKTICNKYSIGFENMMALGDGANDIMMLKAVGIGVAYKSKKVVKDSTYIHIDYSDLTALLFLQGISEKHFQKVY